MGKQKDQVFQATKDLFRESDSNVKRELKVNRNGFTRGFFEIGSESGSDLNECKEAFSFGYPYFDENSTPKNELSGPNVWPDTFRQTQTMNSFYTDMCDVSTAIVRGLSLSLDQEQNYLSEFCKGGEIISLMRLFHYLPYDNADVSKTFGNTSPSSKIGSSPHTDWGFLTLVIQEDEQKEAGSLECFFENEWQSIDPVEGSIVVNCGDYISLFSGGRIKSPLHRVVNGGNDRYSLVFFYYPNFDASIPKMDDSSLLRSVSLLHDQRGGGWVGDDVLGEDNVSFGEYIAGKWASVQRDV